MDRVAILFNPAAGSGESLRQKVKIEKTFNLNKIPFDLFVSESESHLRQLTLKHSNTHATFVLVGGDTTFNIVVRELLDRQIPPSDLPRIGMVGTGSANDIVRSLAVERVDGLCQAIKENRIKELDVGCLQTLATSHYFLGTVSAGFGTTVNRYIENFSSRHPLLSKVIPFRQPLLAAVGVRHSFVKGMVPRTITLEYNNHRQEVEFSLLVFLNIPFYANGIELSKSATPFNNKIDCYILHTSSFSKTLKAWRKLAKGRGKERNLIQSSTFKVICPQPLDWQADGEIISNLTEFTVSIHPNPLKVFVGEY